MREYKLVVFGPGGCGKSGWISKLEAHTHSAHKSICFIDGSPRLSFLRRLQV